MENRNNLLYVLLVVITILLAVGLTKNYTTYTAPLPDGGHVCKEDSLKNVVDSLQTYVTTMEDGFDSKERRYEEILFEYEFGIDRLKYSHPDAFKEFHRIISYRERYSKQDERDNKKRLSLNNF
jgi:hypothetical protein